MKSKKVIVLFQILIVFLSFQTKTQAQSPYKLKGPVLIRPFGDSITYGIGFTKDWQCPVYEIGQYLCMPPARTGGGYRGWMTIYSFMQDGIAFTTEGYQSGGSNASQWIFDTQTHDGYPSWTNEQLLPKAKLASFSNITLVHSGTNDMWQILKNSNPTDAMIDQVATSAGASLFTLLNALLQSNPKTYLFVAQIIKVSAPQKGYNSFDYETVNKVIFKYNNYIANNWYNFPPESRARMTLVDMHHTLIPVEDYFGDGIHPNMFGYRKIACSWIRAIKGEKKNQDDPCSGILTGEADKRMIPSKEEMLQMTPPKDKLEQFLKGKPTRK
ncbi:SGNH/GDSL hydrolase family protein [Leptospira fluminis]|uniref:SGNH/GDSL hydrolase family protein n=1 Tax=Leptospira fluminis TaxID=2484979 RepID=UPI001FE851D9|nr:SGNH/GDSL hydrolase family protein [Leptospira fluminis]